MRREAKVFWVALGVAACILGVSAAAAAQSQTTSTETKSFEVVSVEGNHLVLKGAAGTKEYTVPPGFMFTVDGKQVGVGELKPGMKGTATITTTTTVKPVYVTEVKNGTVYQAMGSMAIVRTEKGLQSFTQEQLDKRNVSIMRDGKPIQLSDLHTGDHLSATIITEKPPQVLTERQVKAELARAGGTAPEAPGAPAAVGTSARASSTQAAPGTPAPAHRLPKTASQVPLVGLMGVVLLAVGAALTSLRRRARS